MEHMAGKLDAENLFYARDSITMDVAFDNLYHLILNEESELILKVGRRKITCCIILGNALTLISIFISGNIKISYRYKHDLLYQSYVNLATREVLISPL